MYEDFVTNQVFIGMPFDKSMADVQQIIEESCKNNNLEPKIVNHGVSTNSIIDEIKELLENSEFLIIDLSLENPNVYYELGYADGVGNEGKDVLLLALEGTDLKFDIKHRRVHFYKDTYNLQEKLKEILPQFIQEGR
jgi:hypothetical protein